MQHNSKDSESPYPGLTICFIKKDSFKPNLENTDGFFLSSPNWMFVLQKKSMKAEGSACHSTFKYSRNHNKACSLRVKSFNGGDSILQNHYDKMGPDYSRPCV